MYMLLIHNPLDANQKLFFVVLWNLQLTYLALNNRIDFWLINSNCRFVSRKFHDILTGHFLNIQAL